MARWSSGLLVSPHSRKVLGWVPGWGGHVLPVSAWVSSQSALTNVMMKIWIWSTDPRDDRSHAEDGFRCTSCICGQQSVFYSIKAHIATLGMCKASCDFTLYRRSSTATGETKLALLMNRIEIIKFLLLKNVLWTFLQMQLGHKQCACIFACIMIAGSSARATSLRLRWGRPCKLMLSVTLQPELFYLIICKVVVFSGNSHSLEW